MSEPTATTGPSDPGLAGERTSLAWARIGLSLLAIPATLLAYTGRGDLRVAMAAAALAVAVGLGLLTASLRRQRAEQGMRGAKAPMLASRQVLLSAATVLLICAAAMDLVLA
jgi:uncharacterized membrane protein YidH (DUF202 family)